MAHSPMHMRDMTKEVEYTVLDWSYGSKLKMGHYHTECGQLLTISSVTRQPEAVTCKHCLKKMEKHRKEAELLKAMRNLVNYIDTI